MCLSALLVLGQLAEASGKPSLRASVRSGAALSDAAILVHASDSVGLDSLDITWPEGDLAFHTGISGAEPGRSFDRTFLLRDLFPAAVAAGKTVRLTVAIRNTRGAKATTALTIPSREPKR